jgi:hypothetical protein
MTGGVVQSSVPTCTDCGKPEGSCSGCIAAVAEVRRR